MSDHPEWPAPLRAALDAPTPDRKGWQWSVAPQLIALFLWVAYFDQVPQEALEGGPLAWPVLGAAVAALLCHLLLYRPGAMWGFTTRQPLGVVATSTFGAAGATFVPGALLCVAGLVWLAVSIDYATGLILRSLVLFHLLDPKLLTPIVVGRLQTPGGLFLVTSLLWCYASAYVGRYLIRVIAALMNVFPVFPALMLGLTTLVAFTGLRGNRIPPPSAAGGLVAANVALMSALVTVQMVFGFFATSGLSAAGWGAAARDRRDVSIGGWVGVVTASWVIATLAILTAAGATGSGRLNAGGTVRYVAAVEAVLGARLAGVVLMTFGLAALAPACYASFAFSHGMHAIEPRVSASRWTAVGAGLAWVLVSLGLVNRLFSVFSLVGGLVAPAAGALAADYTRSDGVWPGIRRGYNRPGLIGWAAGAVVGLTPLAADAAGFHALARVQPAAVLGYVAAFVTYLVVAGLVGENPTEARPEDLVKAEEPVVLASGPVD